MAARVGSRPADPRAARSEPPAEGAQRRARRRSARPEAGARSDRGARAQRARHDPAATRFSSSCSKRSPTRTGSVATRQARAGLQTSETLLAGLRHDCTVIDGAAIARSVSPRSRPRVQRLAARGVQAGPRDRAVRATIRPRASTCATRCEACAASRAARGGARLPADCAEAAALADVERAQRRSGGARHPGAAAAARASRRAAHPAGDSCPRRTSTASTGRNLGALVAGRPTARAVHAARRHGAARPRRRDRVEGRHAVVIGRSSIVGKPLALHAHHAGRHGDGVQLEDARSCAAHPRRPTSSSPRPAARDSSPPTWSSPARR